MGSNGQFRLLWVQWHSLAVALAGLCSIRGTALADQAWACVDRVYDLHASNVADTRKGMLWRPIEKLHTMASAFRYAEQRELPSVRELQLSDTVPNTTMAAKEPLPQAQQPAQMNHQGIPAVPTALDSFSQIDFAGSETFDNTNWLDWERIMDDFPQMPLNTHQNEPQQPAAEEQWPYMMMNDSIL